MSYSIIFEYKDETFAEIPVVAASDDDFNFGVDTFDIYLPFTREDLQKTDEQGYIEGLLIGVINNVDFGIALGAPALGVDDTYDTAMCTSSIWPCTAFYINVGSFGKNYIPDKLSLGLRSIEIQSGKYLTCNLIYLPSSKTLQISTITPEANIYYTTDNSTPTSNSNPYTNTFTANIGTTIKAIGIKEGYLDSDIAEFTVS